MTDILADRQLYRFDLPTGTLTLEARSKPSLSDLCDVAARANPKRGFLLVSKVLGRHLPARPAQMRAVMHQLACSIGGDLPEPLVFLGMAETATALGQGVFAAHRALHPGTNCIYLQTSRQFVQGATTIARFEESHSHASSHKIQVSTDFLCNFVSNARSLVIIDDECSTGSTFVSASEALKAAMPKLQRIHTCSITDWSSEGYIQQMPVPTRTSSILSGTLSWQSSQAPLERLAERTNNAGSAPGHGMRSRSGLVRPEAALHERITCCEGERILVLGDGEHTYEALLIAEQIEQDGAIAAIQSITRTPALLGHAMTSVTHFSDAYGSGAPCFVYNILAHAPQRIIIASEILAQQVEQARKGTLELGHNVPIELLLCTYQDQRV